jgi:FkbM family methyltransferase
VRNIRSNIVKLRRQTVSRLWRARRHYVTKRDWLLSFYHRALLYLPWLPLPWRNATRAVLLRGMREPLHLRLGTSDWYVLEEVFLDQVYEPINQRQLQDVRNILDLGANTGFTIRLWQMLYPGARIVAVEPDTKNLEMCKYNALENTGLDRLKLVQACVAGSARSVFLDRSLGAWRFSMRDTGAPDAEPLPALTLPQIIELCAIDGPIDLLKCDIEGSEEEVFADCGGWIGQVKNMVVELHYPYSSERFLEDLRRGGAQFDVYYQDLTNVNSELLFLERTDCR